MEDGLWSPNLLYIICVVVVVETQKCVIEVSEKKEGCYDGFGDTVACLDMLGHCLVCVSR